MSRRRNLQQDNGQTRRDFLWKGACAALTTTGIASTLSDLRLIRAAAADTITGSVGTDYKALVCIFLFGGNDGNNLLVPTDTTTYNNQYLPARGVLALPIPGAAGGLLPLNFGTVANPNYTATDGHSYGLHPSCTALQTLFNNGKATILCNVGTLLAPLTQAQYRNRSVAVPPQLFSHSDQQIEWQTAIEDQQPRTGWGGRSADLLYSQNTNNNVSMNISLAGSNMFQVGDVINEYNVSTGGAVSLNITSTAPGPAQLQALKDLIALNHTNLYESAFAAKMKTAIDNASTLNAAIAATSASNYWNTAFPTSGLGNQLKMIARLIEAAPVLGHNRQIFFASIGGFDLHSTEGSTTGAHANLLGDVSNCMNALYQAMVQLENRPVNPRTGLSSSVTQFTASDFCRTFPANTDMGADHAWGNHHIVVGGGVTGNRLYGTYPTLAVNGPDDTSTGRWIPTTSVEQYSATLAKWFGVSPGTLSSVFPYLGRFSTPDLGFMG
jgi:uncharacterized protein (DUF1501 family)